MLQYDFVTFTLLFFLKHSVRKLMRVVFAVVVSHAKQHNPLKSTPDTKEEKCISTVTVS